MNEDTPERPSFLWRATLASLSRLPQAAISRGAGWLADRQLPVPLRRPILGGFARAVGIDVSEAEQPLEAYPSLNHFFVRRIRTGLRTWPDDPRQAASPVDGVIGQFGTIQGGALIQAKGHHYSASALLGSTEEAAPYIGGRFLTIYLSPRHYHRIHSPCAGAILGARLIPGGFMPVNRAAVAHVPHLFARNERLVVHLDGPAGRMALVAVAATNVGAISARYDPEWGADPRAVESGQEASGHSGLSRTGPEKAVLRAHPPRPVSNRRRVSVLARRYSPPIPVGVGDEILAFHLGSTVVLLAEAGGVRWDGSLGTGREIALGTALGTAPGAA